MGDPIPAPNTSVWMAGIPAYASCVGRGIKVKRKNFAHAHKMRNGQQDMCSLPFAGDAIFTDPRMCVRPEVRVSCWESARRKLLGEDSLNQDKLTEEGDRKETQILLGYEVGANALTIRLPDAKVGGEWAATNDPAFQPGTSAIQAKKVQILRGLINHRGVADRFSRCMPATLNALLWYADGAIT